MLLSITTYLQSYSHQESQTHERERLVTSSHFNTAAGSRISRDKAQLWFVKDARGSKGEKRAADTNAAAIMVAKIVTGEN